MKALTCEMCNSTDVVKQDGMYVCQSCGTKYTVEEAKKMMIEGIVDVQGTVKVDNSAFVEKYLLNARRAMDKTDWEEVEKYYNMVEQNDPKNIEAIFYSSYGKAMLALTEADRFKREQKFNVFSKSLSVIDDYFDSEKADEQEELIKKMSNDLVRMASSSFVYNTSTSNNITTDDKSYTYAMLAKAEIQFIESIENITQKVEKEYLYHILLKHYARCIRNGHIDYNTKAVYRERMAATVIKIQRLNPSFETPEIPEVSQSAGCSGAGCLSGSVGMIQIAIGVIVFIGSILTLFSIWF